MAARALESVAGRLGTLHGLVLLDPAYSRYHVELGEISSYPPGYKENGGVFCHADAWIVIAETMAGDPDRAFRHYLTINPSAREELADVHRCEPYVYAQMIAGKAAPNPGEAKNSWLTGAAAWNLVAITQWILGIRPEHEGLRIDPCLPADWEGFEATRRFRGATYRISIDKPVGVTGRLARLLVDGRRVHGNVVAPAPEGSEMTIKGTIA
jgi:cellobiose phosphorylase